MAGITRVSVIALATALVVTALPTLSMGGDLPTCFGKPVTIPGTSEDDSGSGDPDENNVMMGFSGADELYGANLADYICGGEGNDLALSGMQGRDRLTGNSGNDTLRGGAGADRIFGRRGDDTITSGPGPDYVDGGAGTDTCIVDAEDTVLGCEA
jgi:Ca2+-binding RTX toxin-like protein